eukprot:TRINITY_DN109839_c0_g1_i1.p1 TRINITY_DN109839_c0_g1~~TRINITY_DN109839_c0_g1_i1.p1  ORF type:complete len:723 (-),score=187.39 TRINITY_DN109839_c0_g1_i1:49-2184(-)
MALAVCQISSAPCRFLSRAVRRTTAAPLKCQVSCFARSALVPSSLRSCSSEASQQPLAVDSLRQAVEELRALPRGSDEAGEKRRQAWLTLEEALPKLWDNGECLKLALQLPLAHGASQGAEKPIKRLLLELSRRLRIPGGLAASGLPHVPALFQRLGLQDQELMDDFCAACAHSWQELTRFEMAVLFRNTENCLLLHATKGTALCRLVASLSAALGGVGEAAAAGSLPFNRPGALAALCHGAQTPKSRASCQPLLEQLRVALQATVEGSEEEALTSEESLELLSAASELHHTVGVATGTLSAIIALSQKALAHGQVSGWQLGLVARACGRLCWVLPAEVDKLYEALLLQLATAEAASLEPALRACRQLPVSQRRQLAEQLLCKESVAELSLNALEHRLQIMHDLSLHAAAHGGKAACITLAAKIEELAAGLLAAQAEASASALASAYLATSTAQYSLSSVGEAEAGKALEGLTLDALQGLEEHWAKLGPLEVQTLFRSPGDVSEVASRAERHVGSMEDAGAVAALLQAAQALPASTASGLAASCGAALQKMAERLDSKQLGVLEAALRKGPSSEGEALRSGVRERLFSMVLQERPVWNAKPARGYIRYVEQCLERGRRPPRRTSQEPVRLQGEASPPAPEQSQEAPEVSQADTKGVSWHSGVEGWEVKVEVGGRQVLGGYFKPTDSSLEALEAAHMQALDYHEDLVKRELR